MRELPHAEVVDDQERDGDELHQILLACAGERRVDEFFEQRVGLAIDHAVALLNRRAADRLREVALASAGRAEKQYVLSLCDEAGGGELIDERAIHLFVEIEIKGVERSIRIAEARQFMAALEEAVLPALEFVTRPVPQRCECVLVVGSGLMSLTALKLIIRCNVPALTTTGELTRASTIVRVPGA